MYLPQSVTGVIARIPGNASPKLRNKRVHTKISPVKLIPTPSNKKNTTAQDELHPPALRASFRCSEGFQHGLPSPGRGGASDLPERVSGSELRALGMGIRVAGLWLWLLDFWLWQFLTWDTMRQNPNMDGEADGADKG